MLVVNPTFGRSLSGGETISLLPVDWREDAIALFSNSKPNAKDLLEGIRAKLGAFRRIDNIDFVYKNSASQPAPADVMKNVAGKYKAALLAIAD